MLCLPEMEICLSCNENRCSAVQCLGKGHSEFYLACSECSENMPGTDLTQAGHYLKHSYNFFVTETCSSTAAFIIIKKTFFKINLRLSESQNLY